VDIGSNVGAKVGERVDTGGYVGEFMGGDVGVDLLSVLVLLQPDSIKANISDKQIIFLIVLHSFQKLYFKLNYFLILYHIF